MLVLARAHERAHARGHALIRPRCPFMPGSLVNHMLFVRQKCVNNSRRAHCCADLFGRDGTSAVLRGGRRSEHTASCKSLIKVVFFWLFGAVMSSTGNVGRFQRVRRFVDSNDALKPHGNRCQKCLYPIEQAVNDAVALRSLRTGAWLEM